MNSVINQDEILEKIRDYFELELNVGFSGNDLNTIKNLIFSVLPNDTDSKTVFPDFVCNDGFVEHFHVTSGESNRKGYNITIEESKMVNDHENFKEYVMGALPEENSKILHSNHSTSFWRTGDSLKNFHKSFKTIWDKHILSLKGYEGIKHVACFLVSSDDVLAVKELIEVEQEDGKKGILGSRRIPFSLSYDEELLDYIYKFNDLIDYVIYFNKMWGTTEIIPLKNIPEIKQIHIEHSFFIYPLCVMESLSTIGIHVPYDE